MVNYRGRLEIMADILRIASDSAKKTHIMYQANLSYKVLKKYLSELLEASLIAYERKSQCYVLTSKGQEYLEVYKKYAASNKQLEKWLNDITIKRRFLEEMCTDN